MRLWIHESDVSDVSDEFDASRAPQTPRVAPVAIHVQPLRGWEFKD